MVSILVCMKSLNSFLVNAVKKTTTESLGVSPRLLVGNTESQSN